MIPPATGELAAHALGTAEEWKELAETLREQLQDARTELNQWRHWGDVTPHRKPYETMTHWRDRVEVWMAKRPVTPSAQSSREKQA